MTPEAKTAELLAAMRELPGSIRLKVSPLLARRGEVLWLREGPGLVALFHTEAELLVWLDEKHEQGMRIAEPPETKP